MSQQQQAAAAEEEEEKGSRARRRGVVRRETGAETTISPNIRRKTTYRSSVVVDRRLYLYSSLAAGVGSGALASLVCAPLDLVRTRMQVWGDVVGRGAGIGTGPSAVLRMIGDIVKREGVTGCFRGLGATLLTVPAFWGVYCKLLFIKEKNLPCVWKRRSENSGRSLFSFFFLFPHYCSSSLR
jgi:hypothetical protein